MPRLGLTASLVYIKYAARPAMAKALCDYIFHVEHNPKKAVELCAAATQVSKFKDWCWKARLGKVRYQVQMHACCRSRADALLMIRTRVYPGVLSAWPVARSRTAASFVVERAGLWIRGEDVHVHRALGACQGSACGWARLPTAFSRLIFALLNLPLSLPRPLRPTPAHGHDISAACQHLQSPGSAHGASGSSPLRACAWRARVVRVWRGAGADASRVAR